MSGSLGNLGLLAAAAAVSVLILSVYEIRNMRPVLNPVTAGAIAELAGICVMEVGSGPAVSFIHFRF